MKRALIIRLGAIGDMIIISPVLKYLKEQGYYVILNTGERGKFIYKHDNRVDEFIIHDEKVPTSEVTKEWDRLKKEIPHDLFINFTESIECNVALHPINPMYNYPKWEREKHCNRNYYDVSNEWAGFGDKGLDKRPTLQFTQEEIEDCKKVIDPKAFNILWCLSGSGKNKVYPWTDFIIGETLAAYPNVKFITVGDERCQLLETAPSDRVMNLSGECSIRYSACLTGLVDLVISPDTGVLHASGCYTTPKIGLLGHTSKENITKYFINDYSIEATADCAPCYRLIYDYSIQCPIEPVSRAAWCMAVGLAPEIVYNKIREVISHDGNKGNKQ